MTRLWIQVPRTLVFVILLLFCLFNSDQPVLIAAKMNDGSEVVVHREIPYAAYKAHQVIVKMRSGSGEIKSGIARSASVVKVDTLPFGYDLLTINGDVLDMCSELSENPSVISAEPNYVRYVQREPDDTLWLQQVNLKLSDADEGWNITTGVGNVIVAVIDTGVDYTHPDLIANLLPGKNFREPGEDYLDDSGHGTAVCGCIGAVGNNSQGVTGAAWTVKILPLRACGGQQLQCDVSHEVAAIYDAIQQGADVINLSIGGFVESAIEKDAVESAWNEGIVIIAAAGNQGLMGKFDDPDSSQFISYPAGYDVVCGVASVDYPQNGNLAAIQRSDFSNYGDSVSVTAMGMNVLTTAPSYKADYPIFGVQKDYGRISGTSFSTPLVSGLAALIKSQFPELNSSEIRQRIETGAVDIGPAGWDDNFGYGLVNFHNSLVGGTHAVNEAFIICVTTNPIMANDIIIIVKTKVPVLTIPVVNYTLITDHPIYRGTVILGNLEGKDNLYTGRLRTDHVGSIEFTVSGADEYGLLPELTMEYFKKRN